MFKAWLQKKREQVLEMRRVQRAKQLEDMSSRVSKASLGDRSQTEGSADCQRGAVSGSRPRPRCAMQATTITF